MPQNEIDSLSIVISADTSKATKNVQTLIKRLGALRNTFKSLNTMSGGIKPLVKGLQDIAKIDFSGAEKSLEALATIINKIDSNKLKQLNDAQKTLGGDRATAMSISQSQEGGYGSIAKSFSSADYSKIAEFNVHISKELANAYKEQANEARMALDPLVQLNERMVELGFSVEQIKVVGNAFKSIDPEFTAEQVEKLKKALQQLGLSSKQAGKVLKKSGALGGQEKGGKGTSFMGRVINRAIFSIVRFIIQAIKDLIKEMISAFAIIDTNFNSVISEAWSAIKFFKNAIMGALAPTIQLLAPIITMIANVLGEILNDVAKWSAILAGEKYYYKAEKSVENFADTLDKTSSTMGIDSLNVINKGDDNGLHYVKVELEETTSSLVKIRELLLELEPIIKFIGSSLFVVPLVIATKVLKALEPAVLLIANVLMTIIDFLIALFTNGWGQFGEKMKALWGNWLDDIKKTWVSNVANWFAQLGANILLWFVKTGIKIEKWLVDVATKIAVFFTKVFTNIKEFFTKVFTSIKEFFTNMGKNIGNFFGNSNPLKKDNKSTGSHILKGVLGVLTSGISFAFTGFATGGFPEDGLFMANHNELVGQFSNGKTAVANNEQITQGIYQAVLQAMRESGNNGNVVINLDGYQIAKVVSNKQNNFGQNLVMGGNLNYGK